MCRKFLCRRRETKKNPRFSIFFFKREKKGLERREELTRSMNQECPIHLEIDEENLEVFQILPTRELCWKNSAREKSHQEATNVFLFVSRSFV